MNHDPIPTGRSMHGDPGFLVIEIPELGTPTAIPRDAVKQSNWLDDSEVD
jgi:hypothetical protein